MAGLGWGNPFPLEIGGGESIVETHYNAFTAMLGRGGSHADVDTTVDGLWRSVRALGMASITSSGERAALQAFPSKATDLLPYYEQLFNLPPAGSEQDRRDGASRAYRADPNGDLRTVAEALAEIDPRFSLRDVDPDDEEVTVPGRVFEDYDATEPFNGGRKSTLFGNYSTGFIVFVLFDIGAGVQPSNSDRIKLAECKRVLNDMLPAINHFAIVTSRGFVLDVDRLDLTSL